MRDTKPRATFGEELTPPNTEMRLERPQGIVETSVEHLAAAAGHSTSEALTSLEREHRTTAPSQ
jgi:hypothetical protein